MPRNSSFANRTSFSSKMPFSFLSVHLLHSFHHVKGWTDTVICLFAFQRVQLPNTSTLRNSRNDLCSMCLWNSTNSQMAAKEMLLQNLFLWHRCTTEPQPQEHQAFRMRKEHVQLHSKSSTVFPVWADNRRTPSGIYAHMDDVSWTWIRLSLQAPQLLGEGGG